MQDQPARRVLLVTGPSGAGRSSAIRALEDIGFEAIDNMPLRLLGPLLETPAPGTSPCAWYRSAHTGFRH